MQVFTLNFGEIERATGLINEDLEGLPTIIYHRDAHFNRCVPCTSEEQEEIISQRSHYVDWEAIKKLASEATKEDEILSELYVKRFRSTLKNEACSLATSGGISFFTGNPVWVLGQSGRTAVKVLGTHIDPKQQRKDIQLMMLLMNSSVGKGLGGNPYQLLLGLGIDLWDLGDRPEDIKKNKASLRNMVISTLKGGVTLDQKKFLEHLLGGVLSEGTNRLLPEIDEKTSIWARAPIEFLKNQDLQGITVEKTVASAFKKPPAPKVGGILTPEEQAMYPERILSAEELQQQEDLRLEQADDDQRQTEYERWQTEYDQWQKDSAANTLALTNANNELIQKEAGVIEAQKYYDEKYAKGQDTWGPKQAREAEKKITNAENNLIKATYERDQAQKVVYGLQGIEIVPEPKVRPKKPKTVVGKVGKWINENVSVSGEANLGTISSPEMNRARGEPTLFHHDLKPEPTTRQISSPYWESRHQIAMDRAGLQSVDSKSDNHIQEPKSNTAQNYGWQSVESMQQQQIFDRNMSYQSPVNNSPQAAIDYQALWGRGVANNVQMPPMGMSSLGQNEIVPYQHHQRNIPIQVAGLLPFVIAKTVPEQTQRKVETWVKGFIQQWKDDPLKARKDLDLCLILGAKNIVVIAVQAFEQPSLKARPNTFGLMEVSDRFDNWFAQKVNIDLTSPNAQMGMFVGEFAMPIPMMGAFKHCTKVGQEAFAFMRQSAKFMKPNPLLDRALAFPQGFSNEVRAIEALQNPVYRSGFAGEKAIQQARKAVNMPSWKKIGIDMEHAVSGHMQGGWRTGCKGHKKSLFPKEMTKQQIETAIRQAYRYGKKLKTQNATTVIVRGEHKGLKLEMYVNTEKKIIETAYPKQWID